MNRAACIAAVAAAMFGGGPSCLGPLVPDTVAAAYLDPGTPVPQASDDPALLAAIDANDGLERSVDYVQGFAAGAPVLIWSLGDVSPQALPMYVLVDSEGAPLADHPPIIDAIPGDAGYHPFCAVFTVEVRDAYVGERIVSVDALRAARAVDPRLLNSPESTGTVRPCPVVHPDVVLNHPSGTPRTPETAYYQGIEVNLFLFAPQPQPAGGLDVPVMARCELRREGGEPLSEPRRRVDMTGDGDTHDTNDVLLAAPGEEGFSAAMRRVEVVVASDYASIDTSGDDATADFTRGSDLFALGTDGALDPVVGNVVAWSPSDGVELTVAEELAP